MNARIEDNLMSADNSSPLTESVVIIFSMPTVRQILDRRTSIPKVLSVLRAATVPRSTEILPVSFPICFSPFDNIIWSRPSLYFKDGVLSLGLGCFGFRTSNLKVWVLKPKPQALEFKQSVNPELHI